MSIQKESLLKGIFSYSISSWINIVVGFLSVIITTRIIEPDEYGVISLFLSASSFLMYILTFGMDGAFIRFYNEPPANNSKNQVLFRIIIYSTVIGLIMSFLMTGPLCKVISKYIFGSNSRVLVLMLVLYTYSQAIFRFLNISFRMGFKTKEYTIQNILINCFSRIVIIFVGLFSNRINDIMIAMGIGMFLLMLIYVYFQKREIIPVNTRGKLDITISLKGYREFIKFSLYSAPSYFVTYFNGFMSQGIIRSSLDSFSLGIFSSCGMFKTIFSALQGGFATYWSAYVYKNHEEDKERIMEMHDYILLFSMICASGLVIFRDIVYVIIGRQYHDSKHFFSLLLIPAVLGFVRETTDKGIALAKRNEIILGANMVSVVINLMGCFFLTSYWGLIGAAYAEAIAGIVLYIIMTCYGQKFYRTIKNPTRSVIMTVLILGVMVYPSLTTNIFNIVIVTILFNVVAVIIMQKQIFILLKILSSGIKNKKRGSE